MSPGDSTLLIRALPEQHRLTAGEKRAAKDFAAVLASTVANNHPFTCLITSDQELQRLNRDFRQKDYPTDVLSFPAPAESGDLGEMAISGERAGAQAREFGHSREQELQILMLHGLLHLAGHDHETDSGEMARIEARWRKQFGLPESLTERAGPVRSAKPHRKAKAITVVTRRTWVLL